MSWYEFSMACKGYWEADKDHWHKIRTQTAFLLQPYSKKNIDPRRLMPFSDESVKLSSDKESFQKAMEFFSRRVKSERVVN